jgi:HD-GYP domain-containing protein (c-di-GMP phosphodiesterase class II)
MGTRPENPLPLGQHQLVIGVYVWIDMPWRQHGFLFNKFRIRNEAEISKLTALGNRHLFWIPSKSTAKPFVLLSEKNPEAISPSKTTAEFDLNKEKIEKIHREKLLIAKAEREWRKATRATKDALKAMKESPKRGGEIMRELSKAAVQQVINDQSLLYLLRERQGEGAELHALNCMSMAMMLGKRMGLAEQVIEEISLAALSHDIGKSLLPQHILNSSSRSRAEENLYRDHCAMGVKLAEISGAYTQGAITAIAEHHEMLDGSGFPAGKKGSDISLAARLVNVVNHYDRLCAPESQHKAAMQPRDALKKMWLSEQQRLDPIMMTSLIKLLGVYPPGTIVELSNGSTALVVSPGKESLLPKVLIYQPEFTKEEAEILDLSETDGLKIEACLNPSDLPDEILKWICPRASLTYYFA